MQLFGLELIKPSYAKALTAQAAQLSQQAKHTGCLTPTALQQLSRKVSLAFVQSGYFKTKLVQKTLHAQTAPQLQLHFSPAHITAIENNTAFATANLFGNTIGKPANIKDIDQGLDQANRLKNHHVSVDVYPQKTGDVVLALADTAKTDTKQTFYGVFGLDNFGDSLTNRLRGQVQLGVANPLGMADNLLFTALSTLPAKDDVNTDTKVFNRSMALNYQVPFGYWTFTAFGSQSQHQNQVQLTQSRLTQKGDSWQAGMSVEKVVSRSAKHISSVQTSLSHSRKKSWFGGAFLGSQSPTINAISLGLNHTQLIKKGVVSANINYRYGRSRFWLNDASIKDNFNMYAANLDVQQFFTVPVFSAKDSLIIANKLLTSYADSILPAGQRETLNSRYTVRGGFDYGVSGDAYVALQNTLSLKTKPIANSKLSLSPYMGLDVGRAYTKQMNTNGKTSHYFQDVVAYLLGVKAKIDGLEANVYASKAKFGEKSNAPFTASDYANKSDAEDVQLNAVLTWRF